MFKLFLAVLLVPMVSSVLPGFFSILILLMLLTENFQQSLPALAVNDTVITKLLQKKLLTVKKSLTAQPLMVFYSIHFFHWKCQALQLVFHNF